MLPHPSPLRLASRNLFSYTWPTCSASLAFAQGPSWLKHPQTADLPVAWDYRGRQSPSHKHMLKPTIILFRCWESNPQCSDYNASAITTEPRSPDSPYPRLLLVRILLSTSEDIYNICLILVMTQQEVGENTNGTIFVHK